jgi:hypothetical protein
MHGLKIQKIQAKLLRSSIMIPLIWKRSFLTNPAALSRDRAVPSNAIHLSHFQTLSVTARIAAIFTGQTLRSRDALLLDTGHPTHIRATRSAFFPSLRDRCFYCGKMWVRSHKHICKYANIAGHMNSFFYWLIRLFCKQ